MGCWKWFNGVLKEAGVSVTRQNEAKIEEVIHKHIGQHSKYGHCSAEWTDAGKKSQDGSKREEKTP